MSCADFGIHRFWKYSVFLQFLRCSFPRNNTSAKFHGYARITVSRLLPIHHHKHEYRNRMTKPFDLHELLARIEANLKRTSNTSCQNDTLTYRDIEINNSLVYIKEVLVPFTSTELKILRLLLQYPQKIFSKQNLYESIWNETYAPAPDFYLQSVQVRALPP